MSKCKECKCKVSSGVRYCPDCMINHPVVRKEGHTHPQYLRDRQLIDSSVFGQEVDLVDALADEFGTNEARDMVARLYKE